MNNKISLFKFRSLSGKNDLRYACEILEKNEFHCSPYNKLNDPMEGFFRHKGMPSSVLRDLKLGKLAKNICSFSTEFSSPLLWVHYGGNAKGICIEIESDISNFKQITYADSFPIFHDFDLLDVEQKLQQILLIKMQCWSYEKEMRLLASNKKFTDFKIVRILLGPRFTLTKNSKHFIEIASKVGDLKMFNTIIDNGSISQGALYGNSKYRHTMRGAPYFG